MSLIAKSSRINSSLTLVNNQSSNFPPPFPHIIHLAVIRDLLSKFVLGLISQTYPRPRMKGASAYVNGCDACGRCYSELMRTILEEADDGAKEDGFSGSYGYISVVVSENAVEGLMTMQKIKNAKMLRDDRPADPVKKTFRPDLTCSRMYSCSSDSRISGCGPGVFGWLCSCEGPDSCDVFWDVEASELDSVDVRDCGR